jgi:RimJ/RimL family protein N-acetyltransferase
MGLREIWAQAPSAHQRSLRVLQRLRFTETGRGDDCAFLDQPTHYRRFAITAVDWATSRGLVFRDVTQPPQQGGHRGT